MSTYNLCFDQKYEKYQNFFSENFHFLVVKFLIYLNRRVFVVISRSSHMFISNFRELWYILFLFLQQKVIRLIYFSWGNPQKGNWQTVQTQISRHRTWSDQSTLYALVTGIFRKRSNNKNN